MKPCKDDPAQNGSRFFETLDRLAGIEGCREVEVGVDEARLERQIREAEPVPLSPGAVDRVVSQWRSLREAAAAPGSRPPWWRRRAALIPTAVLVLLGAAAPVYLVWSGRNSTRELPYEDAMSIVFDERYPAESRLVAQGRVASSIGRGITAIKRCPEEGGRLGKAAELALAALRAQFADSASASRGHGHGHAPGSYDIFLSTLLDKGLSDQRRLQGLEGVMDGIRSGIGTLEASRRLGGRFERNAGLFFANLKGRLSR